MSLKYWVWFCTGVLPIALCARVEAISSAVNISTRLAVQTGNNVGIAGFIIIGNGQKKVCIRALGPTMSNVQGVLADPKLDVYDKTGTLIASNDNSRSSQQDEIIAAGFAPNNDTASDFGRTFAANDSGTDHGWGSHQFVLGGAVQGGKLYGTFPTRAVDGPDDTEDGRWIPTTSVDEFSATLATWFGVNNSDLVTVLPNIGRFAHPNLGFLG